MKQNLKKVSLVVVGFLTGAGSLVFASAVWQGTNSVQDGRIITAEIIKNNFDFLFERVHTDIDTFFEIEGTPGPGKIIAAVDTEGNAEWVRLEYQSGDDVSLNETQLKAAVNSDFNADRGSNIDQGPYAGHGGVFTDTATRNRVCELFNGGTPVSHTARAYDSPGDNWTYLYEGGEWKAEIASGGRGCTTTQVCDDKGCSSTSPYTTCSIPFNNLLSSIECSTQGNMRMIKDDGTEI